MNPAVPVSARSFLFYESHENVVTIYAIFQEVQVLGDWAYMWTKLKFVVTPPGGVPITRAGHTLSVLKEQNGKSLLHRDANMLVTMPAQ
jgi:hypothetical protein